MSKTQSKVHKLSDTQLVMLGAAAQRGDGSLVPFPKSLTTKAAALNKVVETLCKRKLVEERESNVSHEWRQERNGPSLGLFITSEGMRAIGLDDKDKSKPQIKASTPQSTAAPKGRQLKTQEVAPAITTSPSAPTKTKQDVVIEMLRRKPGATIDDIISKTKWQAHSVRGFFSGVVRKKLKLTLVSDVGKDGARRYHITPVAHAKA